MNERPFCGFLDDERVETLAGKTIAAACTDSCNPRMTLVFTDGTAAIITEDTSCCYYAGEHGGMMVDDPDDNERDKAKAMFDEFVRAMSVAHLGHNSTALKSEAFKEFGCYCLVGNMPKTNQEVVNIIRSIFADLLPSLDAKVGKPVGDGQFGIVIEITPE